MYGQNLKQPSLFIVYQSVGNLFAGAKLIVNHGDYRMFSKLGGYTKARSDFEALGLTGVRKTRVSTRTEQSCYDLSRPRRGTG